MKTSSLLKKEDATAWLAGITETEHDVDTIFSLIAPQLYQSASTAIQLLKDREQAHANVGSWPCAFSGIGVIVNRKSLEHRDPGGCYEWYDLLVAAGSYKEAYFEVRDIGAYFEYTPGTAIAICGKLFNHAVNHWEGGERICYAHFMRNNVLNRLQLEKVSWVNERHYTKWMSDRYLERRM